MEVRALREADDRSSFRSGDVDLDRFFAKYAGQNQFRHHIGTTYVAVEGERILGYATVAPGQVEREVLSAAAKRKLPTYPIPVLRLARLAVRADAQGRGVGQALLRHVFGLALRMAEELGCYGVLVDAKRDSVDFYSRFGFAPLDLLEGAIESRPVPLPMFIPLSLVEAGLPVS